MKVVQMWSALAALWLGQAAMSANGEPPSGRGADRVASIQVEGDLQYMKIAKEFADAVARGPRSGTGTLRIYVSAGSARTEVITAMARAIRESAVPIELVISDRPASEGNLDRAERADRPPIDAKYLLLAACADSALLQSKKPARIEVSGGWLEKDPARDDAIDLMTTGLVDRGVDGELAGELARAAISPRESLWVMLDPKGQAVSVRREAPAPEEGRFIQLVSPIPGGSAFSLSADLATSTGFACPPRELPSGVSERSEGRSIVLSGSDHERRVEQALSRLPSIDYLLTKINEMLDLPDPAKHSVSKDTYRKAGQRELEKLAQTREQIEALEQDLRDYPELLRTAPPGQTEVGAKPSSFAAKWRSMIQSRKDKLEKLKKKAERFAAQ